MVRRSTARGGSSCELHAQCTASRGGGAAGVRGGGVLTASSSLRLAACPLARGALTVSGGGVFMLGVTVMGGKGRSKDVNLVLGGVRAVNGRQASGRVTDAAKRLVAQRRVSNLPRLGEARVGGVVRRWSWRSRGGSVERCLLGVRMVVRVDECEMGNGQRRL